MHYPAVLCEGLGTGLPAQDHQGNSLLDRNPPPQSTPAPGRVSYLHREGKHKTIDGQKPTAKTPPGEKTAIIHGLGM